MSDKQSKEKEESPDVIGIKSNGIFLSYQMLILLVGGLISLGLTIAVWNSYDTDIKSNEEEIAALKKSISNNYELLNDRIEKRHFDAVSKVTEHYVVIERRVDKNNERFKDWLQKHEDQIDKLKEETIKLKYTKQNR